MESEAQDQDEQQCFVIMPISDQPGYPEGHFGHVYRNIIKPACEEAGYKPVRADDVTQTNMIHADILLRLYEAPLAICDLSSRNPNVLFELGIRQAFDKPVVLIQDDDTPQIFDISGMRYLGYKKEMKFHDVLVEQRKLVEAIRSTANPDPNEPNTNSIVKLLALQSSATLPSVEGDRNSIEFDFIRSEMRQIRSLLESKFRTGSARISDSDRNDTWWSKFQDLELRFNSLRGSETESTAEKLMALERLQSEVLELIQVSDKTKARWAASSLLRKMSSFAIPLDSPEA